MRKSDKEMGKNKWSFSFRKASFAFLLFSSINTVPRLKKKIILGNATSLDRIELMEDKIREELVFILINSVIICSVRNKYLFFFSLFPN